MKTTEKGLNDLKPYENNPRINENAVEYVENSIKEFGFKVPIVVDKNNVIVCGHTRYMAAQRMGLEKVPCVTVDDLSEEQVNAFRLVDNKTQELAEWDWNKIHLELAGIEAIDMKLMGFADFLNDEERDELPEKKLGGGKEIDLDSFSDEQFKLICPCCGFRFNE